MNLSKSRYIKGVQCSKMLWMDRHMPEQFDDSVMNQAVLETGSAVGDLAMGYFGDFVEVAFREHRKSQMLEDTQRFLVSSLHGEGPATIAEASFDWDGNFCSVDILRVDPDGVHIVEVKSSTHINEIYYHDMAYQTWVLTQCGLNVKTVSLMHLNNQYERQGELDLQQLFMVEDCSEIVFSMQEGIEERTLELKALADNEDEPVCAIGEQCKKPYSCGYRGWCWRNIPVPSVFDLNRITMKTALELKEAGVLTLPQVIDAGVKLSNRQALQVRAEIENRAEIVDVEAVEAFLNELKYPLYFLDFETFQPAIPPFDGTRPYQQIPSQYSLHVLRSEGAALEHREFLAEAGVDPRLSVAQHLVADIPAVQKKDGSWCVDGTTLAYNISFEKGRINEMADFLPDLAKHLLAISNSMQDLMTPFLSGAYYARAMGGSNSIKAVLPALFPNDPDLDYHALEGVHNGAEAMDVFAKLENMDAEEASRIRLQLLKYCELDTFAMVKIWQKLMEKVDRKVTIISNRQKYLNYQEQMKRLKKALASEFYLEAIFLEYAIIEDRIESVLRHAKKFNPKNHGTITSKLKQLEKMCEEKKGLARNYFSPELIDQIGKWKERRNSLVHALMKQNVHTEDLRACALDGEMLVKELKNKTGSFNRAVEKAKA